MAASAAKEVLRPTLLSMSIIAAAMMPIFTLERARGRIFPAVSPMPHLAGALFFTLTCAGADDDLCSATRWKRRIRNFLVVLRHY